MYPNIYFTEPGKSVYAYAGAAFFIVSALFVIFALINTNATNDVNKQKNFNFYLLLALLSLILMMYCNIVNFAY